MNECPKVYCRLFVSGELFKNVRFLRSASRGSNKKAAHGRLKKPKRVLLEEPVGLCQTLVDLVPVHHVPPGFQVVRAAVLIFQIVGVLPNVVAKDRKFAVGNGIVLVGSRSDLKLTGFRFNQPGPAAAELVYAGGLKLFLKCVEAAESFVDGVGNCAGGI